MPKPANNLPKKDGGEDLNESDGPKESKRSDNNDSTDHFLKEIGGGDDEMSYDEEKPPKENIDSSYCNQNFIQVKSTNLNV